MKHPKRNCSSLLLEQGIKQKFTSISLNPEFIKIPNQALVNGRANDIVYGAEKKRKTRANVQDSFLNFNKRNVEKTGGTAGVYTASLASYLAQGTAGLNALKDTIEFIQYELPEVPVILDLAVGVSGKSSVQWAQGVFDWLNADAITVMPYGGYGSLKPLLEDQNKMVFVSCLTARPGAKEFQKMRVVAEPEEKERRGMTVPLYWRVSENVFDKWNCKGNCGLMLESPFIKQIEMIRAATADMPLFILGMSAKESTLRNTIKAAKTSDNKGFIIDDGSTSIFTKPKRKERFDDAAGRAAEEFHERILQYV